MLECLGWSDAVWPGWDVTPCAYKIGRGVLHFFPAAASHDPGIVAGPDAYILTVNGIERGCGYCMGLEHACEKHNLGVK